MSVPVLSSTMAVEPCALLERLAAADQDAVLGRLAGADHDRGRRGQPERARAGDDQHRDRGAEREGQPPASGPEEQPADEGQRRATTSTAGTKYAETGSASRCIGAFEPCASSTRRTIWASVVSRADRGGAEDEACRCVLSVAPMTVSPDGLLDRQALAGQHALVDAPSGPR